MNIEENIKLKDSLVTRSIFSVIGGAFLIACIVATAVFIHQDRLHEKQVIESGYSLLESFVRQSEESISKGQRKDFQQVMDNMALLEEVEDTALYAPYGFMTYKSGEVTVGKPFSYDPSNETFVNPNREIYVATRGLEKRSDWSIVDRDKSVSGKKHIEQRKRQGLDCLNCHISINTEELNFSEKGVAHEVTDDKFNFYYQIKAGRKCLSCHTNWKENQIAGHLRLSMNKSLYNQQRNESVMSIVVIIIFILGPTTLLMLLVLRFTLLPLTRFMENFEDLAQGEGDLSKELFVKKADEIGKLSSLFNRFLRKLRHIISKILQQIIMLDKSTHDISAAIGEQSATLTQQAASVTEVTATVEELSASSKAIASHSKDVAVIAEQSLEETKEGLGAMTDFLGMVSKINEISQVNIKEIVDLGEKSKEISKVMELINNISDQTKLIAFNAALEASSAGDAGKRFNVVAVEIRRLADNVMESTGEIEKKVNEIQEMVEHLIVSSKKNSEMIDQGMASSQNTAEAMEALLNSAQTTADAAKQISTSTEQQQIASDHAAVALKEIEMGTAESTQNMRELENVISQITSLSQELKAQAGSFKLENLKKTGRKKKVNGQNGLNNFKNK